MLWIAIRYHPAMFAASVLLSAAAFYLTWQMLDGLFSMIVITPLCHCPA